MGIVALSLMWCGFSVFMFIMGSATGTQNMRNEAIKRGFVYYDPKTREFKWKEPTT